MNHRIRNLVRASRPRRRAFDALDVGFRISIAVFMDCLWILLLVLLYTSPLRGVEWFWWSTLGTLPLLAVNCYALLTAAAFLDDRAWARAQRDPRDTPSSE